MEVIDILVTEDMEEGVGVVDILFMTDQVVLIIQVVVVVVKAKKAPFIQVLEEVVLYL